MDSKIIGGFICERRQRLGMTQQQLADVLDVTNKAVSKWETGEGYPDITIVPGLAKALNVTADELLAGEEKRKNNGMPVKDDDIDDTPSKHRQRKSLRGMTYTCIGIFMALFAFTMDFALQTYPLYVIALVLIVGGLRMDVSTKIKEKRYRIKS